MCFILIIICVYPRIRAYTRNIAIKIIGNNNNKEIYFI